MFQVLHCADLHLDTGFASAFPPAPIGSWRRADLRATLGRILTLARERQVDAVTIAGDLYEQDYVLPDTADFLAQQFARLAPIRVFIAPGEHDPYTNDSLYALTRWPENVTVFSQGQLAAVELASGIHLWGAACPPSRGHKTLDRFHVDREGVNLLLLHATDRPQHELGGEALFMADADTMRSAGFDFALLGHHHTGHLCPEESPCCAYPGSPEPLTPEEADGAHQVTLLTIQDGVCTPEMIPISQWRYRSWHVDLTGCESIVQAGARVERTLQARLGGDEERTVCQVTLTGRPNFDLNLTALAEQVTTKAHLQFDIQLTPSYNLEQLAQEQTVRGLLVRRFLARLEAAKSLRERNKVEGALLCALRALDGKQVNFDEVR